MRMKKLYTAPAMECMAFFSDVSIADEDLALMYGNGSAPWNDGELGWT